MKDGDPGAIAVPQLSGSAGWRWSVELTHKRQVLCISEL